MAIAENDARLVGERLQHAQNGATRRILFTPPAVGRRLGRRPTGCAKRPLVCLHFRPTSSKTDLASATAKLL